MVKKVTIIDALEPFLSNPRESLHLAYISKQLKKSHPTVRKWLNTLEKKGILKKGFKGRLTLYSLNLDNQNIVEYLIIAEKTKLIKKCEEDFILKELVYFITLNFSENTKTLIFGSSVDSFRKANDIDLLVTGNVEEKNLKDFSKKFNKEIHIIKVASLDKISEALKKEIIKKHLIIKGDEEIVRWMLW